MTQSPFFAKQHLFKCGRDVEEILGHLLSIFKEDLGLYLVQEAQFQKKCYDEFTEKASKKPINQNTTPSYLRGLYSAGTGKYGSIVNGVISRTTLSQFKAMSWEIRASLIEEVSKATLSPLTETDLEQLEKRCIQLDDLLATDNEQLLNKFTLEDILFFDQSPLKFIMMKDSEFKLLTLDAIEEMIKKITNPRGGPLLLQTDLIICLKARLQSYTKTLDIEAVEKENLNLTKEGNVCLSALLKMSSNTIQKNTQIIPAIAFAFFSKEQLKTLQLTDLTVKQNSAIFDFLSAEEIPTYLSLFSDEDIIQAINQNLLIGDVLAFIPNNLLSKIALLTAY